MGTNNKPMNFPAKATIIDFNPQSLTLRLQLLPMNDVQAKAMSHILLNAGAIQIVRNVPTGALSLDVQLSTKAAAPAQSVPAQPAHGTLSAEEQAKASAPEAISVDPQSPAPAPVKTAPVMQPQPVAPAGPTAPSSDVAPTSPSKVN